MKQDSIKSSNFEVQRGGARRLVQPSEVWLNDAGAYNEDVLSAKF